MKWLETKFKPTAEEMSAREMEQALMGQSSPRTIFLGDFERALPNGIVVNVHYAPKPMIVACDKDTAHGCPLCAAGDVPTKATVTIS